MKFQAWMMAVALALASGSPEAAPSAQGSRARTCATTSKGTKTSRTTVPESSLGSAERRALLSGKGSAASRATGKLEKPKVKS